MKKIRILKACVVDAVPRGAGDIVEVEAHVANLLVAAKRAAIYAPAPEQEKKRRGRPKKVADEL